MTHPATTEPSGPRFRIPLWAWGATLAVGLFFALTLWQAKKLQQQLTELQLQMRQEESHKGMLEAQRREMERIRALLAAPETRAVQLKPAASDALPIKVFWNERLGILVSAQKAPVLPANFAFQLWISLNKGGLISVGGFRPDAKGTVLTLLRPASSIRIRDAAVLTVTVEPPIRSPQPTSEPLWVGRIR